MDESKKSVGPRSALRALDILALLAEGDASNTLASVSKQLSLPKTSTLSLLRMLEMGNYVRFQNDRYELSFEAFHLALAITRTCGFPGILHQHLEQAVRACGETCFLGCLTDDQTQVEYVDVVESPNPLRYTVHIGDLRPLHSSTVGKISLAHFTPARLDQYFRTTELERYTSMTITDEAMLRADIANIRKTGIAENASAMIEGLLSFGVPIYTVGSRLVGALVVSGPEHRIARQREELRALLVETGREMSRIMNALGPYPPAKPAQID